MFRKFLKKDLNNTGPLFNGHFIEVKTFYVTTFGKLPCIYFISELDVSQAFTYIRKNHGWDIRDTWQHSYFDHDDQCLLFNNTIFVLNGNRIIELANNHAQILFQPDSYAWANALIKSLSAYRKIIEPELKRSRIIGFARPTLNNQTSPETAPHTAAHSDDSDRRTVL